MSSNAAPVPDLRQIMREHRGFILAEGIIFLIAGFLAVMLPFIASGVLAIFIGWMSLVIGILLFVRGFALSQAEDRGSIIITGFLFVVLGLAVLFWPEAGLRGLTLFMAAFCILRGIMDLSGMPHRSSATSGLQVLSGLAGLVLGILLLVFYPNDAEWAPGLLFGVQLLLIGMGTLAIWNALDHPEVSGVSGDRD